jgi:hypothetical protein
LGRPYRHRRFPEAVHLIQSTDRILGVATGAGRNMGGNVKQRATRRCAAPCRSSCGKPEEAYAKDDAWEQDDLAPPRDRDRQTHGQVVDSPKSRPNGDLVGGAGWRRTSATNRDKPLHFWQDERISSEHEPMRTVSYSLTKLCDPVIADDIVRQRLAVSPAPALCEMDPVVARRGPFSLRTYRTFGHYHRPAYGFARMERSTSPDRQSDHRLARPKHRCRQELTTRFVHISQRAACFGNWASGALICVDS